MTNNDGGPAFPCHTDQLQVCAVSGKESMIPVLNGGMCLRDWLAGQAIEKVRHDLSLSLVNRFKRWFGMTYSVRMQNPELTARNAYAIADAMIVEREKDQP